MAHRMHVINPDKPVSLLDVHMWISNGHSHNSSLKLLTDSSTFFGLKNILYIYTYNIFVDGTHTHTYATCVCLHVSIVCPAVCLFLSPLIPATAFLNLEFYSGVRGFSKTRPTNRILGHSHHGIHNGIPLHSFKFAFRIFKTHRTVDTDTVYQLSLAYHRWTKYSK